MSIRSRARQRVGRQVRYFATDAEASTANDDSGAAWPATIVKCNVDGTVNLLVQSGDGTAIDKTDVEQSDRKGGFSFYGVLAA